MPKTTPGTEAPIAPELIAPTYVAPRKTIERQGARSEPYTRRYPQVRGGICEFCGVIDKNTPAEFQYKLCPHFREMGTLRCSYCDESKNPDDIVYHSILNVAESPDNPNSIIVWCNAYTCSDAHIKRFKRSRA